MSQAKRDAFDIDRYLKFFKSFFKGLALFPPASWFVCVLIFDSVTSVTVWAVTQCLPACSSQLLLGNRSSIVRK